MNFKKLLVCGLLLITSANPSSAIYMIGFDTACNKPLDYCGKLCGLDGSCVAGCIGICYWPIVLSIVYYNSPERAIEIQNSQRPLSHKECHEQLANFLHFVDPAGNYFTQQSSLSKCSQSRQKKPGEHLKNQMQNKYCPSSWAGYEPKMKRD